MNRQDTQPTHNRIAVLLRAVLLVCAMFALAGAPAGAGELSGLRGLQADRGCGGPPLRSVLPPAIEQAELSEDSADYLCDLLSESSGPEPMLAGALIGMPAPGLRADSASLSGVLLDATQAGFRSRAPPLSA